VHRVVKEHSSRYLTCLLCPHFRSRAATNRKHITKEKYSRAQVFFLVLSLRLGEPSYQAQQLYNVVADVASYPSFIPFCTGSRIIAKARHGDSSSSPESMDVELTVGFLSLKESYVSRVTCKPFLSVEVSAVWSLPEYRPHHRAHLSTQAVASSSTPLFKTLSTTWRFQSASPNSPHASAGHLPPETPTTSIGQQSTGPTLVTLDLTFAFSNPVHAKVSAAFFGQVSKLMVKAFEEHCMKVYGPGNK
jgi:coenzyme Q-binding protein COQ10